MSKSKNLACPFCAGNSQKVDRVRYVGMRDGFQVRCATCGSTGGEGANKFEAWQEWNARAGGHQPAMSKTPEPSTSASANGSANRLDEQRRIALICFRIVNGGGDAGSEAEFNCRPTYEESGWMRLAARILDSQNAALSHAATTQKDTNAK